MPLSAGDEGAQKGKKLGNRAPVWLFVSAVTDLGMVIGRAMAVWRTDASHKW